MNASAIVPPATDPTPIFEIYRGSLATDLLTAAVAHFDVFGRLAGGPMTPEELRAALGLAERPAAVLLTALRAMGLLVLNPLAQFRQGEAPSEPEQEEARTEPRPARITQSHFGAGDGGRLELTPLAREHLVPGGAFDVGGYVGLSAQSPGVLELVERLRTNRPAGADAEETGAAFIFREGIESAMERAATARHLTLALAGRARSVAPVLAQRYPLEDAKVVLDVGGGTGIYAIAWLQRHPGLRAIVWDRPEVLKVAAEMAAAFGVADRLECRPGDMFRAAVPAGADAVLLSNVLHDWDIPECRMLLRRCAEALPPGGRLLIHDVFLNDGHDGPLPIALYSASLFRLTEGRAYSAAEYRAWITEAGLVPGDVVPTLIHCGVLPATRPR